jgi:hypothetical protein
MKQVLHNFLSCLLIGAVLLLGISPEAFHDHEEHEHHCETAHIQGEVDACHLRIYHDGGSAVCADHQHLLDGAEACAFCQLHLHHFQILKFIEESTSEFPFASTLTTQEIVVATLAQQKNHHANRGPPKLV